MNPVHQLLSRFSNRSLPGQTMAEYGLILALVAIAAIAAWELLGTDVSSLINHVATSL